MTTIAFIGLGNMGIGMATNLAKAGHEVRALDISKDAVARAVDAGCVGAANAKDAVENADVVDMKDAVNGAETVITMLPAGAHVKMVYGGEDGVFEHASKGMLMIDCSTIVVASAREVIGSATHTGFDMSSKYKETSQGGLAVNVVEC
jgi:3-hydroxyisobutyrate dehydrogenase